MITDLSNLSDPVIICLENLNVVYKNRSAKNKMGFIGTAKSLLPYLNSTYSQKFNLVINGLPACIIEFNFNDFYKNAFLIKNSDQLIFIFIKAFQVEIIKDFIICNESLLFEMSYKVISECIGLPDDKAMEQFRNYCISLESKNKQTDSYGDIKKYFSYIILYITEHKNKMQLTYNIGESKNTLINGVMITTLQNILMFSDICDNGDIQIKVSIVGKKLHTCIVCNNVVKFKNTFVTEDIRALSKNMPDKLFNFFLYDLIMKKYNCSYSIEAIENNSKMNIEANIYLPMIFMDGIDMLFLNALNLYCIKRKELMIMSNIKTVMNI